MIGAGLLHLKLHAYTKLHLHLLTFTPTYIYFHLNMIQEVDCVHSWGWPPLTFPGNHTRLPLFSIQAGPNFAFYFTSSKLFYRYEKRYMEPFIVIGPVLIGGGIMTVLFSVEVTPVQLIECDINCSIEHKRF